MDLAGLGLHGSHDRFGVSSWVGAEPVLTLLLHRHACLHLAHAMTAWRWWH